MGWLYPEMEFMVGKTDFVNIYMAATGRFQKSLSYVLAVDILILTNWILNDATNTIIYKLVLEMKEMCSALKILVEKRPAMKPLGRAQHMQHRVNASQRFF